jgi:hypothetical protein
MDPKKKPDGEHVTKLVPLPLKEFNSELEALLERAWLEYEKGGES